MVKQLVKAKGWLTGFLKTIRGVDGIFFRVSAADAAHFKV